MILIFLMMMKANIRISMMSQVSKILKFQTQSHTKIPMKAPMKSQKAKCNLIQKVMVLKMKIV